MMHYRPTLPQHAVGREVERMGLARAVRWHLEDRFLVDGNRTVVFE
jgi:formyltetrahydrofolate deformylase